jgi:hypothetical protein
MSIAECNAPRTTERFDHLICAVLRGERPPWLEPADSAHVGMFLRRSDYHGVSVLLNEWLYRSESWPAAVRQAIHDRALAQAVLELRNQQVLTQVQAALADIGVQPVFLKGTALAYALYPDPMLRTRGDTDIIIPSAERRRVHDVLTTLGFKLDMGVSGEFISYEASYTFTATDGGTHNIDLHWRINNSALLSRLFSYDELLEDAIRLPKLCPEALGLSPVHALLVACMHRATHRQNPYYADGVAYYSADRLIWLYDVLLLSKSLSSAQWHNIVRLARDKGLCATCLDGIERARARFHMHCPEFVLAGLAGSGAKEHPAIYLNASKLRQQWMDFRALDGFSNQLQYLQELVFPSTAYMRTKYPQAQHAWLPLFYARRALGGLFKRLKMSRQTP